MVIANNILAQRFNTCTIGTPTFKNNAMTLFDGIQGPAEPGTACAASGNFRLPTFTTCITSQGNPSSSAPDPRLVAGVNPCVDTGTATYAPGYDFYGSARSNPDVGAAER